MRFFDRLLLGLAIITLVITVYNWQYLRNDQLNTFVLSAGLGFMLYGTWLNHQEKKKAQKQIQNEIDLTSKKYMRGRPGQ